MAARDEITLVIVNARIRTGDARRPWADAAALAGTRVVRLGSSAEIRKLVSPAVRTHDALGVELDADALGRIAGG